MKNNANNKNIKVIAPLFDRLIDLDPGVQSEAKPYSDLTLEELKLSIRQEIGYLLNTRESKIPFSFRALNENMLADWQRSYGLPDFSTYDVTSIEEKRKLSYHLKILIESYEPRFVDVKVTILKYDNKTQSLHISLEGEMKGDPLRERFTFPVNIEHIGD